MASKTHTLVLDQNGQNIVYRNDLISILGDLTVKQLVAIQEDEHGYSIAKQRHSLLRSPEGFRIPNAGCLPAIQMLAEQHGIEIQVYACPAITCLPLPQAFEGQQHSRMAQFVCANNNGIIRIPQRSDAADVILEIAQAFPAQRIIVLHKNVKPLHKIASKIKPYYHRVKVAYGTQSVQYDEYDHIPRIICSTFIEVADIDFATSDIVIFLDANHVVHERAQLLLEQIDARFSLFGIERAGGSSSSYEIGKKMAVFGPNIIDLRSNGLMRRTTAVKWLRHEHPSVRCSISKPEFRRVCIWNNKSRNRRIVNTANHLLETLRSGSRTDYCSVTILVNCIEHADKLLEELPNWPIVCDIEKISHLRGKVRTAIKRGRQIIDTSHQIVLSDAAHRFSGHFTDAVIFAGAGPSVEAIPHSWLYEQSNQERMLIYDFEDQFNSKMKEWSNVRRQKYADRDIFDVGVSTAYGRTQNFLRWLGLV